VKKKGTTRRNLLLPSRWVQSYAKELKKSFNPTTSNVNTLNISQYLPSNIIIQQFALCSNRLQMAGKSGRKQVTYGSIDMKSNVNRTQSKEGNKIQIRTSDICILEEIQSCNRRRTRWNQEPQEHHRKLVTYLHSAIRLLGLVFI
jgi:hypothetical protein